MTELKLLNTTIKDISPVRALVKMKSLYCEGRGAKELSPLTDMTPLRGLSLSVFDCNYSEVSDLSPLRDMSLKRFSCAGCRKLADLAPLQGVALVFLGFQNTPVSDLSPLRGMTLVTLLCYNTKITDLSALKDMPLKDLRCDFDPKRDTAILRSIKTLEQINGVPVAEFWKQVESGTIPSPMIYTTKDQQ